MMGAAGALCCLLAGTAAGSWLRDRRLRRLRTLRARLDVVASLRDTCSPPEPVGA